MLTSFINYAFKENNFIKWATILYKVFFVLGIVFIFIGVHYSFFSSPIDAVQKQAVRIMYIHVPVAWISMMSYFLLVVFSVLYLCYKQETLNSLATSCAICGAIFTLCCLITGSFWAKPMWGTWWVWDARLTSVLIMFLLYIGYIVLKKSFDNSFVYKKICAIFAIIGGINLPIIQFSVVWWNTLHQPPSIKMTGSTIDSSMLVPLIIMVVALHCIYGFVLLLNALIHVKKHMVEQIKLEKLLS